MARLIEFYVPQSVKPAKRRWLPLEQRNLERSSCSKVL
jgi:hypothetical protein